MAEMVFQASVDAIGRIRFDAPELAAAELSRLSGKRITVTIKRERTTRSLAQNRLLWGQAYAEAVANSGEIRFVDDNGVEGDLVFQSREAVHDFAKLNLIATTRRTTRGMLNLLGSTTEFSESEFTEYLERFCAKMALLGVYIPPAGVDR